ncbi:TetR/AcrR family transcriptional regulator C-terminal domain-containing protein [Micromonospora sonneratiae]|uniref:TetR/AcrR family transcriptional regulator n=1 Tax=Micromonospora sonneratiae TaxID=1184706 RepID=A0ABW3YCS6_9ACTN
MVVFAGQGDARRSMTLLWRTAGDESRTGPGRKPGLTVEMIVEAAIVVADTEGMAGLSMNAVGQRLGRTGMALYTYVPSKNELVDLMHDHVLAELPTDYEPTAGWRAAVTAWSEDLWTFYLRHPWMLQVSQARPVLGPNEYAVLEALLRILRDTGLSARSLNHVASTLFHLVRGAARMVTESRQAVATTEMSEDQWWLARSALLDEVAPDFAERFPVLAWLSAEGSFRHDDESAPYMEQEARETFQVGLTVLLDGIESAIPKDPHRSGAD